MSVSKPLKGFQELDRGGAVVGVRVGSLLGKLAVTGGTLSPFIGS